MSQIFRSPADAFYCRLNRYNVLHWTPAQPFNTSRWERYCYKRSSLIVIPGLARVCCWHFLKGRIKSSKSSGAKGLLRSRLLAIKDVEHRLLSNFRANSESQGGGACSQVLCVLAIQYCR